MLYLTITETIIRVLYTVLACLTFHFVIFAVIGILKKKTFPKAKEQLRYGIIIPARNEERVVANLIESVYKCKYPQDKLHVFVIAHNCTDRTAEIARATGATVYEYNNPQERTMGYAFRYLFDRIREDYGIENYDGFFLFNADNVLDKYYFEKMNDAFVACDRKCVITSFRNSKNFGANYLSALYGLYFVYGCRMESRGRTVLGLSTRVQGTGYVINSNIVKNGWKYVTLTEDWEFTADQLLAGSKIVYCDEAVFYDEQPTQLRVMWRQRVRWAKGHLLVCVSRWKEMIKMLFTRPTDGTKIHRASIYDISVNIMPVCVISAAITVLQILFVLLAPAFGVNAAEYYPQQIVSMLKGIIVPYVATMFPSFLLYFLERKRLPKMSLPLKLVAALLWPIFLFVSVPAEIAALFMRDVGWAPIPHSDTTAFDDLNQAEKQQKDDTHV
ncbi:MAG: glycosyltransferase family 2 protein [Clostridia bacterium]|nr:glycosyltransferase family 2 protein [Clostridia bacterium]